MRLRLDDERDVTVPIGWAADRLRTAYAMTVHKAQGLTVDVALVDTTGLSDRNSAYVAASRARRRTELHHTDTDELIETLNDDPFSSPTSVAASSAARQAQRMARHREQRLASDQRPGRSPSSSPRRSFEPYENYHQHDRGYGISR